ncbi:MAG TPA: thioester reductase domain-containing protein [Jatrophihabitans sp.]|jgi:thioester reductase-like protein|uniref:thioester reductase domain-containing protein n=1 Tax=Jatrophihabitans sp. TaxID=1932789 RepID=UPI002EDC1AB5
MMDNPPTSAGRAQLIEALRTINMLQEQLVTARQAKPARVTEPIAIVGRALRMPGGASSPEAWWPLLRDGVDATTEFPTDRADTTGYLHPDPEHPGTAYVLRGGFLEQVDGFDPAVFGISPREAIGMDPQQRMALELCWEALEDAAIAPDQLTDSPTGVFIGVSTTDYVRMRQRLGDPRDVDAYQLIGEPSFIAGRISYTLGLQGPSCVMDTACSSSLVALHQAVRSLRLGETNLALVGGVNLMLDPYGFILMSKFRALAADGRCKTFDDSADGYARGEGGAIIALQRLSDAIAERRVIHGVIAGTSVNHDGRSSGMTVPNPESQQQLMRSALLDAGLAPSDIDYVEAHGTGTALGDPIELRSINAVYGDRPAHSPVVVGSVKSNIGHLEPAAGIAGLTKVLLSLRHGQIPPNLHLRSGNSKVDWDRLAVTIPTAVRDWSRTQRPRIAAINSFGASGTNAHTIVIEAPEREARPELPERAEALLLSARTPAALRKLAERYRALLADTDIPVADLCWTSQSGRARLGHSVALLGASVGELNAAVGDYLDGTATKAVRIVERAAHHQLRSAWMFTGQGAQYPQMAAGLLAVPAFADAARECTQLFDQHLDVPLAEVIWGAETGRVNDTAYTQPALFTVEYAMAMLLTSVGLRPAALVGHSIGEIVAATVAGVLTLPDATRLVAARGRLMSALPSGGAMLAVSASEARVAEVAGALPANVSIAAVNSPSDLVLSGAAEQISTLAQALTAAGVKVAPLTVSHAFHSPLLDPMLDQFRTEIAGIKMRAPQRPLVSSVTGQWWDERCGTTEYWIGQARGTVRFADAMGTLDADGCGIFIEVGPHPVLTALGQRCLSAEQVDSQLWTAPLRRGADDRTETMGSLAELCLRGLSLDWAPVHADIAVRHASLPTYPWERERYWFKPSDTPAGAGPREDGLGQRLNSATPTWQDSLDAPLAEEDKLGWVLARAARAAASAGLLVGGRIDFEQVESHLAPAAAAAYPALIQTSVESEGSRRRIVIRSASVEQAAADAQWHLVATVGISVSDPDSSGAPGGWDADAELLALQEPAEDEIAGGSQLVSVLRACQQAAGAGVFTSLEQVKAGALETVVSLALQRRADSSSLDCWLLDSEGVVVGHLTGLKAQAPAGSLRAPWYRKQDLVLVHAWQELSPVAQPSASAGGVTAGHVLLVGGPAVLASVLTDALTDEGAVVEPISTDRLRERLDSDDLPVGGRIVLLDAAALPSAADTTAAVLAEQAFAFEQLVLLVMRCLSRQDESRSRLSIVTHGAVRTDEQQRITGPAGAPLWGLGRVLAVEHFANWGGLVDIDPEVDLSDAASCAKAAVTIGQALLSSATDDQQAQRGQRRFGARVRAAEAVSVPKGRPLLSAAGTVLITGGLGGIGLALTEWCSHRGVSRLVLTSRNPEPQEFSAEAAADRWVTVRRLRAQGVDVVIEAVDVTDEAATAKLVGRLAADPLLPLRGVIHAAGVSEPQFVVDADEQTYRRVWAPKVLGAWALHEATRGLDLDLFVLFSSIASSWGSQHLASYAAGNAFLDALADTRAAEGLPVTAVAWGPWQLPSSLFGQDVLDFLESVGLRELAADQCLNLLGEAVASGRSHQIVCAADWSRYRPVMEARGPRPILADIVVDEVIDEGASSGLAAVLAAGQEGGRDAQLAAMTELVGAIAAGVLGVAPSSISADTDVFALGLDSVMVMEVTGGCRRQLGLSVTPAAFFERSTLGEWAEFLLSMVDDSGSGGSATESGDTAELAENLSARSQLPADIELAAPARAGLGRRVLLTGATGFVGAYLLRELLAQDSERVVDCLVRTVDDEAAMERILANAGNYFSVEELDVNRIRIVAGDLAAAGLGLAAGVREKLLAEVDSVVHNGAWVNFAHTYEQLAPANVNGTIELLRLCAESGVPMHHVSTYGIWGMPVEGRDHVSEDEDILTAGRLITGYVQTKWAAEHVVRQAAERGIPASVYRLGRVLGDSTTGAALTTHFTCRVIKSCIQLGVAPDLDISIEMTPVDYVARSLVSIAAGQGRSGNEPAGQAYHLVNPVHMPFEELIETIRDRGWKVESIPAAEWWERLLDTQGVEANDLHSVMPTVQELIVGGERAVDYDTGRTAAALAGTGVSCPPLDRTLLDRYFDYFLATGYLSL